MNATTFRLNKDDKNCPYTVIRSVDDFPTDIRYGLDQDEADLSIAEKGTVGIPLVTRSTEKKQDKKSTKGLELYQEIDGLTPFPAGSIAVPVGGGKGSVAHAKRITRPFYVGRDVYVLIPKDELTDFEIAFHIENIRHQAWRYDFGRQMNSTFGRIDYPRNPTSKPNLLPLRTCGSMDAFAKALNRLDWKDFSLTELGTVTIGQRMVEQNIVLPSEGKGHPFVSALVENNKNKAMSLKNLGNPRRVEVRNLTGSDYVSRFEDGELVPPNAPARSIAFNYNADVGQSAYQEEAYYCYDDCFYIRPKGGLSHPLVALFLVTCIRQASWRWPSMTRKCGKGKIDAGTYLVSVPVKKNGKINVRAIKKVMKKLPFYSRVLRRPLWYHRLKMYLFGI